MIIENEVHARAGLLGNPSDIYGGKVISFLIREFSARVQLWESPTLTFRLHPVHDKTDFEDLNEFVASVQRHGLYGMQRIIFGAVWRFTQFAKLKGLSLREDNFTLAYETSIPRQTGLGGSSAMIISALQALVKFHDLKPLPSLEMATLALSVETEALGITAGLQDRIVQSVGGMTYMDLSGEEPQYERLDMPSDKAPRFGLAYLAEEHFGALESGRVHARVRALWEDGDQQVRGVMAEVAECAEQGREALLGGDHEKLRRLMDRNFELRRGLFGDEALGEHNIELIQIAREHGLAAKLPGSSGAALILLGESGSDLALAHEYRERGYKFQPITAF